MLDTPEIIQTTEQLTAVIHLCIPAAEIRQVMGPAIHEVIAAIHAQGAQPAGPCFSWHLKMPSDTFDFEVGFPVAQPITPTGRVTMSMLPSLRAAHTVYHGGYEGLGAAWGEFCQWIDTQGLGVQSNLWECYASGPESSPDPAQWRTELYRPLAE